MGATWVTPKKFLCTASLGMSSGEPSEDKLHPNCTCAPFAQRGGSLERDSHAAASFPEEKGAGAAAAQLCGGCGTPCPASPTLLLLRRDAGAWTSMEGWEQHQAL